MPIAPNLLSKCPSLQEVLIGYRILKEASTYSTFEVFSEHLLDVGTKKMLGAYSIFYSKCDFSFWGL